MPHIFYYRPTVREACILVTLLLNIIPSDDLSDKTIKLWKVFEKSLRVVSESNHFDGQRPVPPPTQRSLLRLPRTTQQDHIIAAVPRKVYSNAHAYHIHSISVNSDQETYISADDLRINLWNLNISDQSFSKHRRNIQQLHLITGYLDIVDIKPVNMEELTEVITATEFHPTHCNLFMYSSSKSNIKLADMRDSALCDRSAKCES
jgi:serine/threonine-protein phosphatase 2A regulatory subunit B